MKQVFDPNGVNCFGDELPSPASRSPRSTVPAAVPSLTHGSLPTPVPDAVKNTWPLDETSSIGLSGTPAGVEPPTGAVPPAVPSLITS